MLFKSLAQFLLIQFFHALVQFVLLQRIVSSNVSHISNITKKSVRLIEIITYVN